MKKKEKARIRQLSVSELLKELSALRDNLATSVVNKRVKEVKNIRLHKTMRSQVAFLLTVMKQKETKTL